MKIKPFFYKIGFAVLIICVLWGAVQMALISFEYYIPKRFTPFLHSKLFFLDMPLWRYAFFAHVIFTWPVLFLGAIQFFPNVYRYNSRIHKVSGFIYLTIIVFISAPSGAILGYYANGGLAAKTSFLLLSFLWMLFTILAAYFVFKQQYILHGGFLIRSYALALSAIMLRFYALVLSYWPNSYSALDKYTFIAWLSWVPNLLLAEWLIQAKIPQRILAKMRRNNQIDLRD